MCPLRVVSPPVPQLRVIPAGSPTEPTDAELLRAFSAGDSAAFGQLIRRHQEVVFRVVRRFATSAEDARDLTQRAFLKAFEHAERAAPKLSVDDVGAPFKAWVLRIAVNLAKNHVRDSGRWLSAPVENLDRERGGSPTQEAFERAEAEQLTRRAVLALPPRQREVFALRIDAGLSFAELAQALGISEGNAKSHFHYAVKRLKEEVAKLSTPGGRS